MSTTTKRRLIAAGVTTLVMAAGVAGSASAVTGGGSVSGSASVFVPAALKPHELCVSVNSTSKCRDVPGTPAVTLTARFTADAAATAPAAAVARCAGGGVVRIPSGGGTLSGSATVSGPFLRARALQFGPTAPGATVTVSFCNKA